MNTNSQTETPTHRGLRTNGPFWLTMSSMSFAVMAVSVRVAGLHDIPGSETTLVRFLFGLAFLAVIHKSGRAQIKLHRRWLLAARGFFGGIAILLYFLSLAAAKGEGATTLTNSVFLGNSYFIYAPLFGALLIRERLRPSTAVMVVVALFGLYLVAQPDLRGLRAGDFYGFFAGITSAVAIVIIRELRKTESAVSVFFSLCVFGATAGLIAMFAQHPVWPDAFGWRVLVLMGVSSTFGQLAMTYAMRWSGAGETGIIQMTTVVYSSTAGILLFGDPFSLRILLGAILVLAAGAYISFVYQE